MKKIKMISAALLVALLAPACMTPNQRFQKAWYDGARHVYRVPRTEARSIAEMDGEFRAQLALADRYGGARVIYLGDSNAEYAARRRTMAKFDEVAVNIGVGGTATDDWTRYFEQAGAPLRERIRASGALVLISLGGNDVLQDRLHRTTANYRKLRAWFPRSMVVLIPPIHVEGMFRATGKSRSRVRSEIEQVNRSAAAVFGADVIDTGAAFRAPGGEAHGGVMRDPIHFSDLAYQIIIETANEYLKLE